MAKSPIQPDQTPQDPSSTEGAAAQGAVVDQIVQSVGANAADGEQQDGDETNPPNAGSSDTMLLDVGGVQKEVTKADLAQLYAQREQVQQAEAAAQFALRKGTVAAMIAEKVDQMNPDQQAEFFGYLDGKAPQQVAPAAPPTQEGLMQQVQQQVHEIRNQASRQSQPSSALEQKVDALMDFVGGLQQERQQSSLSAECDSILDTLPALKADVGAKEWAKEMMMMAKAGDPNADLEQVALRCAARTNQIRGAKSGPSPVSKDPRGQREEFTLPTPPKAFDGDDLLNGRIGSQLDQILRGG